MAGGFNPYSASINNPRRYKSRRDGTAPGKWDMAIGGHAPPLFFVQCGCGQITCTRHVTLLIAMGWAVQLIPGAQQGDTLRGTCPSCHHTCLEEITCARCGETVFADPHLLPAAGWQMGKRVLCPDCARERGQAIAAYDRRMAEAVV
jgi:hypothetical protein